MAQMQRLRDETGKLQALLAERNKKIENLEKANKSKDDDLVKLTERNAVLRAANEDLQNQLKEKTS